MAASIFYSVCPELIQLDSFGLLLKASWREKIVWIMEPLELKSLKLLMRFFWETWRVSVAIQLQNLMYASKKVTLNLAVCAKNGFLFVLIWNQKCANDFGEKCIEKRKEERMRANSKMYDWYDGTYCCWYGRIVIQKWQNRQTSDDEQGSQSKEISAVRMSQKSLSNKLHLRN